MKHSEAVKILTDLRLTVIKVRSNMYEAIATRFDRTENDALDEMMLEQMFPWLFGEKCILTPLNRVLERVEDGTQTFSPGDFYNILVALWIRPETWSVLTVASHNQERCLPEPNYTWLKGWDS